MSILPELRQISRLQAAVESLKPVCIIHPGCQQPIFALPAFPYPLAGANNKPVHGVDHRLILDACNILTNHAAKERDCYLSKDHAGRHPIPRHSDILAPAKYYYHLGRPSAVTDVNYPIVTDFTAWKFPDKLPRHWTRPDVRDPEIIRLSGYHRRQPNDHDMWDGVTANDGGCVVTKYKTSYGVFHLVPREHQDWFVRNQMDRYTLAGDRTGIHDAANGLTLRLDLGCSLEQHGLVFYPAPKKHKFMTYVCRWNIDYVKPFHRRLVTIAPRVSDQFLYARFAHTMIKLVNAGPGSRLNPFPIPEGATPSKHEYVPWNEFYNEGALPSSEVPVF